jgi:hypothetical protein
VGVVNRKRDLELVRREGWYRIPESQMKRGIQAEYLAFFLSRAFGEQNGGIHYYARVIGLELAYRRWLLPNEPNHPRADEKYYRIALGELFQKSPAILNPTNRSLTFVYTTWDRFVHAQTISDLYSKADYFVDRVYHALRQAGMRPQRFWEAEQKHIPYAPGIKIAGVDRPLYVTMQAREDALYLDWGATQTEIIAAIRAELAKRGGLADIGIFPDDD